MIQQIQKIVNEFSNISVICHRNPDADAIGSMYAMSVLLQKFGCENVSMVCIDEIPSGLTKIFSWDMNISHEIPDVEACVFVDCSSIEVSGFVRENFMGKYLISIDHHASHTGFGNLNIVNDAKSSTCEMVFDFYESLGVDLSNELAMSLCAGILFDTGGLQHSSTSSESMRVVGKLQKNGADVSEISKILFKECNTKDLRMLGNIFKKAKVNKNGVLSCIVDIDEINDFDCCEVEIKKAINFLNQVQGKKIALLGITNEKDQIKISMRSESDKFDVSKIAQLFDGGGHKKAAGFRIGY